MDSKINKLIPNLRFPEFRNEGEWKEETLGGVCEMQAGKFVDASDIQTKPTEGLFPCYGGNGLRGFTKSYTHIGKFSLIGRQGALCGNVTFVEGKFHATEHALVSTPKNDTDTLWLFYVLELLNLNQYATGQAQPGLSVSNLERVKLAIPSNPKEQTKIALCLSSLDEVIVAHTQRLEVLKEHKKGLMQNLFPREGEMVPRRRFPKFAKDADWCEKALGELLEFKNGINASKEQYGKGVKFINVLDILLNEFITHEKIIGSVDVSEEIVDKFSVNYGDILFQRSSETQEEVGTSNVYLDKHKIATFGGFVIRGKKIGEYDPVFLNKILKSRFIRNSISSKSGGSTRFNIGQEILSSIKILLPNNIKEQEKIAECLTSLDSKVQNQEKKIEQLKIHKKGLMQSLFPKTSAN